MKNNYQKYIKEVWNMKEKAYKDFKKSGYKNIVDYIKDNLKDKNLTFANKKLIGISR